MAFELPVDKMITQLMKENFPEFNVREGTAFRDMLIKPSALIVQPQRDQTNVIKKNLSLSNFNFMQDEEFDAMLGNVFVDRRQGARARGTVRMFFSQPIDIAIDTTISFSTEDLIEFTPLESQSYTSEEMSLNTDGVQFFIDTDVEAVDVGIVSNISENVISFVINGPADVIRVDNSSAFAGGTDLETRSEAFFRAKKSISVRDLVTRRSIETVILDRFPQVGSAVAIGFGDGGMERDIMPVCTDYLCTVGTNNTGDTTNGSNVFVDISQDFIDSGVFPGATLRISSGLDAGDYVIRSVTPTTFSLDAILTDTAAGLDYLVLGYFVSERFHVGGKVDLLISSTTVTQKEVVITSCPQSFILETESQSFYEGNSSFSLPYMGAFKVFEIDLATREELTELVDGIDFRFVTLDSSIRFSSEELVQFELIQSNPADPRYFVGTSIQIEYFTDTTISDVNDFVQSDFDRVVTSNYLVKSGRPTFVDVTIDYSGSPSEEEVADLIIRYIQQFQFATNIEVSDMISSLYFFNVTFVDTETVLLTSEILNPDDSVEINQSRSVIELQTDSLFIPRTIIVNRV